MGNENGSGPSSSSGYDCRLIFNEVDKFYTTELNKGQFVGQLFSEISNSNHPLLGNVSICNTFIMERFYTVLIQKTRSTTVNTDSFKALIEKMYKNPEKAIKSRLYFIKNLSPLSTWMGTRLSPMLSSSVTLTTVLSA